MGRGKEREDDWARTTVAYWWWCAEIFTYKKIKGP